MGGTTAGSTSQRQTARTGIEADRTANAVRLGEKCVTLKPPESVNVLLDEIAVCEEEMSISEQWPAGLDTDEPDDVPPDVPSEAPSNSAGKQIAAPTVTDAESRLATQLAQLAVENQRLQVKLSEVDEQRVKHLESDGVNYMRLVQSQSVAQAQGVALGELQRRCEELERLARPSGQTVEAGPPVVGRVQHPSGRSIDARGDGPPRITHPPPPIPIEVEVPAPSTPIGMGTAVPAEPRADFRVNLTVPAAERGQCEIWGGVYDAASRVMYAPPRVNLRPLARWLPFESTPCAPTMRPVCYPTRQPSRAPPAP